MKNFLKHYSNVGLLIFEFPDENGNPYKSSGGEMVDSELGEIPRSWKVDELGNYIKIKSGKRPKNKVDKEDIENVVQ